MDLRAGIAGKTYKADLTRPISLAIPLIFDGAQPSFFGAPDASATPFRGDRFIGDTALGGSCNVSEVRLIAHCNGTHTENVGHIVGTDVPAGTSVGQGLMAALLISVPAADETGTGDRIIAGTKLSATLDGWDLSDVDALVVRTLPNSPSKKSQTYDSANRPAYFSEDAMRIVADMRIRHLLVDIPSIDKMHDHGKLANHRLFWNVESGSAEAGPDTRIDRTITEMIFVDDGVTDGLYLLDLQVPLWHCDAAPSNPVLYPLKDGA